MLGSKTMSDSQTPFCSRPSSSVIILDEARVRKDFFGKIEPILKKIERIEDRIESFNAQDQRLFESWLDISFRDERQKLVDLNASINTSKALLKWVDVTAQQRQISRAKAYRLMKQEKHDFESGDEVAQRRITEERLRRDQWTENAEQTSARSPEDESAFVMIRAMDMNKIRQICADGDAVIWLLSTTLELSRTPAEDRVFLKIWDSVSIEIQTKFVGILSLDGVCVTRVVERMRDSIADLDSAAKSAKFGRVRLPAVQDEKFKNYYRKLARLLHPDLKETETWPWQRKMWERVQLAYREQNAEAIEQLLVFVLLRQRELKQLTFGEIKDAQAWLQDELHLLELVGDGLKRQPAWGFSKRKTVLALKKKTKIQLDHQIAKLEAELSVVNEHIALLDAMESAAAFMNLRHPKRGRPSNRKSRSHSDLQGSLFDLLK
jgi:hypothetical protein